MIRLAAIATTALLSGCSTLLTVDTAAVQSATDNKLCFELAESDSKYTPETIAGIRAEMQRRGGIDCSQSAQLARTLSTASVDELCVAELLAPAYYPEVAAPARAELDSRQAVCDQKRTEFIAQAFIAKRQQESQSAIAKAQQDQAATAERAAVSQAMFNASQLILLSQPAPPPPPVHCTTTYFSGIAQTACR